MLALRPTRRHLRRLRHERPDVAMMLAFGAALAILSGLPALLGIDAGKGHRTIVIAMTANARAARFCTEPQSPQEAPRADLEGAERPKGLLESLLPPGIPPPSDTT